MRHRASIRFTGQCTHDISLDSRLLCACSRVPRETTRNRKSTCLLPADIQVRFGIRLRPPRRQPAVPQGADAGSGRRRCHLHGCGPEGTGAGSGGSSLRRQGHCKERGCPGGCQGGSLGSAEAAAAAGGRQVLCQPEVSGTSLPQCAAVPHAHAQGDSGGVGGCFGPDRTRSQRGGGLGHHRTVPSATPRLLPLRDALLLTYSHFTRSRCH